MANSLFFGNKDLFPGLMHVIISLLQHPASLLGSAHSVVGVEFSRPTPLILRYAIIIHTIQCLVMDKKPILFDP